MQKETSNPASIKVWNWTDLRHFSPRCILSRQCTNNTYGKCIKYITLTLIIIDMFAMGHLNRKFFFIQIGIQSITVHEGMKTLEIFWRKYFWKSLRSCVKIVKYKEKFFLQKLPFSEWKKMTYVAKVFAVEFLVFVDRSTCIISRRTG